MSQPVILTLWAPDFKETDNNLWAVCVQISHHGAEKSKATAWRRRQFKLSLRRQEALSEAKRRESPAMSSPALA